MIKRRVWIAGAAVVAALAAVPLTKVSQASAQATKVVAVQGSVTQTTARVEQPQALSRDGRAVRVVYGAPASAR